MISKILLPLLLLCFMNISLGDTTDTLSYNYLDEMANAACVGMSVGHNKQGHITAVRRTCSSNYVDCNQVCKNAAINNPGTGTQTSQWECFDSLKVYKNHPKLNNNADSDTDSGKVGPVIYRFGGCHGGCGPNYCCCVA